jgi:uncharacterized protein
MENPFYVRGYRGKDTFCDRENETKSLIENAKNGIDSTLISIRRQGKTGLIHHVFNHLKVEKAWKTIYVDIYATTSLKQFIDVLASSIFETFPNKTTTGKKFFNLLKSLSVNLTFDPYSGNPEVSFNYSNQNKVEHSIKSLFQFLDTQNLKILIAFDEFQQVLKFNETNVEATLRTSIQGLKNVQFIFSGSHTHLISEIFQSAKRPFFSSTRIQNLKPIQKDKYIEFIEKMFVSNNKQIEIEAIEHILNFTFIHTFYVQSICNKVFSITKRKADVSIVNKAIWALLDEQEPTFFQYRNLLTNSQWQLLMAIGKEEKVYKPTSSSFILKYQLVNGASVKRSLEALIAKEMVLQIQEDEKFYFRIYDVFLLRWLKVLP